MSEDFDPIYPEDLFCKLFPNHSCQSDDEEGECPFYADHQICPSILDAPARLREKIAHYENLIAIIEKFLKEEG